MRVFSSRETMPIGRLTDSLSIFCTSSGLWLLKRSRSPSRPWAWPLAARRSRSATGIERRKAPETKTTFSAAGVGLAVPHNVKPMANASSLCRFATTMARCAV